MRYYPINLDVKNKKVLVVGAGKVALQKMEGLLQAQAEIRVVAKHACSELYHLAQAKKLKLEIRAYEKADLENIFLVFAATNDPEINHQIYLDTREMNILLNAVDQPSECDFTIPARVERGDLLLTFSTGGKGPFLSKLLRKYFENKISPEWEDFSRQLFELRQKMLLMGKGKDFAHYMDENSGEICAKLMDSRFSDLLLKIYQDLGVKC